MGDVDYFGKRGGHLFGHTVQVAQEALPQWGALLCHLAEQTMALCNACARCIRKM